MAPDSKFSGVFYATLHNGTSGTPSFFVVFYSICLLSRLILEGKAIDLFKVSDKRQILGLSLEISAICRMWNCYCGQQERSLPAHPEHMMTLLSSSSTPSSSPTPYHFPCAAERLCSGKREGSGSILSLTHQNESQEVRPLKWDWLSEGDGKGRPLA